ncbi:hypothetical protein T310_4172 [Rasamsonia emersonii CBS 393.64]|uniref:Uncharacterized protein n=1 Tax=Rasamsonia emersonii (strain ATCC 16479 / CBS 393.64 / IMI 116815) TaxID=1408163 RepID=A0A0F4YVF5_RASE3|nr:hypothetical protein T310_4172 [Rasamsonia emersonii CBS 393.64]KKA21826.1 hypothetical protein T310_4172 [Rasamsonia emersonii CBS 393.64]
MEPVARLRFLFNITPVDIRENLPERRIPPDNHWAPPLTYDCFTRDRENSTGWCRWTSNGVRQLESPPTIRPSETSTCSIFFDSERSSFLITRADCSRQNVSDLERENNAPQAGWGRVGFNHGRTPDNQTLSIVSFHPAEAYTLSARGSPYWMPQLIPATYDKPYSDTYTVLAGELSILLGFAAFTCEPTREEIIRTIGSNFRLPRWIPHPESRQLPSTKSHPRCHTKGFIVKIAPDPYSNIRGADLNRFQEGEYGALIC